jgi:hypothetical protein
MQPHADVVHTPGADPVIGEIVQPLGSSSLQLGISPRRIGLVVRRDSIDEIRRAMTAASSIWGGQGCPLLPVNEDGEIDAGWIQIAQQIGVTATADFTRQSYSEESAWKSSSELPWQHTVAAPLDNGEYWAPHPSYLYPDDKVAQLVLIQPSDDSLLCLANAGKMIEVDREAWAQRGARITYASNHAGVVIGATQTATPSTTLATTRIYDAAYQASTFAMSLGMIWIAEDENSITDYLWYWNLRALRPIMSSTPPLDIVITRELARRTDVAEAILRNLTATSLCTPSCAIISASIPRDELVTVRDQLGLAEHDGRKISEGMLGRRPDAESPPLTAAITIDPRQSWLGNRLTGASSSVPIQLQRPTTTVTLKSPVPTDPLYVHGAVVLRIQSPVVTGPRTNRVAKLYMSQAEGWENESIYFHTELQPQYSFNLSVPDPGAVLEAACLDSGHSYTISDKGRQLRGIIDSTGGNYRIFLRQSIIAVIRALTAPTRQDMQRMLAQMQVGGLTDDELARLRALTIRAQDRTVPDIGNTARRGGTELSRTELSDALSTLIKYNLVARGFRADCPRCGLREFRALELVTPVARCYGCGAEATYSQAGTGEPALYYRLNSLLNVSSQNG